ncbi:MAG: hypothetical protein LAP39_30825 [Acidobacteriia bacterium]|nr:hypothetical protein [Terriglobia bacterium]
MKFPLPAYVLSFGVRRSSAKPTERNRAGRFYWDHDHSLESYQIKK